MDNKLEQIIKSTAKLYRLYGIKSVTMDDISRELSLSKKTLYQYVTDKNDLVDKVVKFIATKTNFAHCADDKGLNAIEKHVQVYQTISKMLVDSNPSFEYDLHKYYPLHAKKLLKSRRSSMFEKMKEDLNQGIKEGYFRAEINVEKVVILNMIRIEGLKDTDLLEKYNYKLIDILNEFFNYHLFAIATPKGIAEYKRLMNKQENA